jgi:hypothetical protein
VVQIPFPITNSPGQRPYEGSGRLINVYAEPRGEELGPVWHRAPGADLFATSTNTGFRGGLTVGASLFAAWNEVMVTVNSTGGLTAVDTLAGTDKISMARNNNAIAQVAIVTDAGALVYDSTQGDLDAYPDGDVGSPVWVTSHLGFFIFAYGNGDMQASDLNSTNLNTLNKARAESNPDGLLRVESWAGQLYALGTATIEVWGDPVNTSGFPFSRVGYNITPGLITAHATAGWQPEFGNAPLYVGSDNTVRRLNGLSADKVSPPDLDRLIAAVTDKDDLEACCYVANGFAFWELSCDDWSWVFNLNSQTWHERKGYLLDRSRFTSSVFAFDKWVVGDTESGKLLSVANDTVLESTAPLIAQIESADAKGFPNRTRVARADFDFVVGVGEATGEDPIETDPSVLIEWSNDGGASWSVERDRKLGRQANTGQRVTVLNSGQSGPQGRRWRLTVSDPVHFGFLGGEMSSELRRP